MENHIDTTLTTLNVVKIYAQFFYVLKNLLKNNLPFF
jgi:hypothetical protein